MLRWLFYASAIVFAGGCGSALFFMRDPDRSRKAAHSLALCGSILILALSIAGLAGGSFEVRLSGILPIGGGLALGLDRLSAFFLLIIATGTIPAALYAISYTRHYKDAQVSLGSAFNMQYLQELSDTFTPDKTGRRLLWDSLKHSAVRYNFENLGYETVGFETGFAWLDLTDADHFMSPPPVSSGMTEFEGLFLRTTLARYAPDLGWVHPDELLGVVSRDRFNTLFDSVDDIAKMPTPTFSYLHLISPHPPFVFDAQGNPTHPADFWNDQGLYPANLYQQGYLNQLQFLNQNVLQAIDTIMANSEMPPVIIIIGDHGPWLQPKDKRFWILTAIYFPEHKDKLYSTITLVNIFRLVFNTYFGGKYDILKDVSYFSPVPNLYDFSEMPFPCDYPDN